MQGGRGVHCNELGEGLFGYVADGVVDGIGSIGVLVHVSV